MLQVLQVLQVQQRLAITPIVVRQNRRDDPVTVPKWVAPARLQRDVDLRASGLTEGGIKTCQSKRTDCIAISS
jgi:hypothetical protein